jgi:flagellar protein FliL
MAEKEETKKTEEAETPKESKSFMKLIVLGVIVVVLAAGGFTGWFMFMKKDVAQNDQEEQTTAKASENKEVAQSIVVPLDSFIVNLMDRSGSGKRYLKTTIELDVPSEESRDLLDMRKAQLRDTILLLLTSQSFAEINSMEGKLELKQALLVRINQALGDKIVRRLYFTEFVVQ